MQRDIPKNKQPDNKHINMHMENQENNEEVKEIKSSSLVILLIIIFLVWLASLFLLINVKDRGTFGDMFGGVNALFSGFAFAGVIYAIFLQKCELSLQRRELQYTREELRGQKEQLESQNITLQKQNFEETFFQLLRLHNDIVNSIDLVKTRSKFPAQLRPIDDNTIEGQRTIGRDCFVVFYH